MASRKYSVESKDSDADSAKSSLLDANESVLRDFGKEEEEEDQLETGRDIAPASGAKAFAAESEEALLSLTRQHQQQAQMLLASGAQQAKMDEGYVSAEKVHPADPIGQSLALFETSLMGVGAADKRSQEPAQATTPGHHLQQNANLTPAVPNIKSPPGVPTVPTGLQAIKEAAELDFARHQDYSSGQLGKKQQQHQQKAAEEELTHYFNHAVAAAASSASAATAASGINAAASTNASSMSSWSEQLQQLQQQQLQQQQLQQQLQLMDTRSWQASSFSGQVDQLKAKQPAAAAAMVSEQQQQSAAEKKATETMLAAASQQQQQQYQEALISQMLSYQTKQMNHQQQLAYAQQYMKVRRLGTYITVPLRTVEEGNSEFGGKDRTNKLLFVNSCYAPLYQDF
jgi:hypothetical protein